MNFFLPILGIFVLKFIGLNGNKIDVVKNRKLLARQLCIIKCKKSKTALEHQVCGSDGKTYPRPCLPACHGAVKKQIERNEINCKSYFALLFQAIMCHKSCPCKKPVLSQQSLGVATRENPVIRPDFPARTGKKNVPVCLVPYRRNPVCGTDGKSYVNPKLAECFQIVSYSIRISILCIAKPKYNFEFDFRKLLVKENVRVLHKKLTIFHPQIRDCLTCTMKTWNSKKMLNRSVDLWLEKWSNYLRLLKAANMRCHVVFLSMTMILNLDLVIGRKNHRRHFKNANVARCFKSCLRRRDQAFPVCGTDGKTYKKQCLPECFGAVNKSRVFQ